MDVEVPVFVKDPSLKRQAVRRTERYRIQSERLFLDGPVSDRVAVLDFDAKTGALHPGARFVPGKGPKPVGSYAFGKYDGHSTDARFLAVAVFGGVMQTIAMFEEPETLGRRVDWAFDGPQLLVVPRAGDAANAFYERDSRSLQFFSFVPPDGKPPIVHTCKSQDIIAHETTHALIDAVAPDLYDAVSPQSQAIHEGVADIGSLLMSLRSPELVAAVLEATGGDLHEANAFPTIAEQFGREFEGRRGGLRNLTNERKMTDRDLDRTEPHVLSTVFSGALYDVFVRAFEAVRAQRGNLEKALGSGLDSPPAKTVGGRRLRSRADHKSPGFALWFAGRLLQRFVLRALDFLPPGEISFADYGRAMIAADRASYPGTSHPRTWLKEAFAKRRIASRTSLDTRIPARAPRLAHEQLDDLATSDFAAYQFAEDNRALLGLPLDAPFEVRKRQIVQKQEWHANGQRPGAKQLLFKVSWTEREVSKLGGEFPRWRQVHVGTTLVYDVEKGVVCARLTTGGAKRRADERADRDGILRRLRASGALRIGDEIEGIDGLPAPGVVHGQRVGDALRVRGMARMLHVAEVE